MAVLNDFTLVLAWSLQVSMSRSSSLAQGRADARTESGDRELESMGYIQMSNIFPDRLNCCTCIGITD